jgi:ABC-2 type transport system permease protein
MAAACLAWCLPSSHVFEGMRALMFEHMFRADLMWQAAALNILYLLLGAGAYLLAFNSARQRGLLLQVGE